LRAALGLVALPPTDIKSVFLAPFDFDLSVPVTNAINRRSSDAQLAGHKRASSSLVAEPRSTRVKRARVDKVKQRARNSLASTLGPRVCRNKSRAKYCHSRDTMPIFSSEDAPNCQACCDIYLGRLGNFHAARQAIWRERQLIKTPDIEVVE
jgi:hypothetical protein